MSGAPPDPGIDWRRIERWADALARGDAAELRAAFAAAGARGPELRWRPPVESLSAPQLRFLLRYWEDLRGAETLPHRRGIDAIDMRPALGYINLLEPVDGGNDFRYRVFGTVPAAVLGFDLTGRFASDLKAADPVVEFGLAVLRAVQRRREPLFTEHSGPAKAYTSTWQRLILPFGDDDGTVSRLLLGVVPLTRDGRPVVPRL